MRATNPATKIFYYAEKRYGNLIGHMAINRVLRDSIVLCSRQARRVRAAAGQLELSSSPSVESHKSNCVKVSDSIRGWTNFV